MNTTPDRTAPDGTGRGDSDTEVSRIVISGLDEPEGQNSKDSVNVSPVDEAVNRLNAQKARGEPEDEDG